MIDVTNRIQKACDNGQHACGVYVDFKKAFDTVNRNILMDKIVHYGVRGTKNNWYKTYLTNRKEQLTVNGQTFEKALIGILVPRG